MSNRSTASLPHPDPHASPEGGASADRTSGMGAEIGALDLLQQECLLLVDEFHGRVGGARLVDIATELGVPSTSVSRAIRHLSKAGLVCRRTSWRLLLTDSGAAAVRALRARCHPVEGLLLAMGQPERAAKREAVRLQKGMGAETLAAIRRHLPRVRAACCEA